MASLSDACSSSSALTTDRETATEGAATAGDAPAGLQQTAEYEVKVVTGSSFGAGTDGQVFLSMEGADGVVGEVELTKSSSHKNPFERGQEDVFNLQVRRSIFQALGTAVGQVEPQWSGCFLAFHARKGPCAQWKQGSHVLMGGC